MLNKDVYRRVWFIKHWIHGQCLVRSVYCELDLSMSLFVCLFAFDSGDLHLIMDQVRQ